MFDKINIQNRFEPQIAVVRAYVLSLRDIRNVGLLAFIIIVLLISWSGVKSIQTNYGLQKQIAQLAQENDVRKLENTNLGLQNQYFDTSQYLEISARQNLGLLTPGETELLVPKEVALAHTVKQPNEAVTVTKVPKQPFWQRNFQAWVDFFLHRDTGEG